MAETQSKEAGAQKIVKKYMLGALAVGIIPFPVLDMAALTGIQVKMLHSLSKLYGLEFSEHLSKSLIASLLGGTVPLSFSANLFWLLKNTTLYGQLMGMSAASLLGAGSTYAIGRVFIQHFESGGTFLTLDPERVRTYYAQEFEKGKEEIRKNFAGLKP
jgi:uncharacterized protein (DUF697 family)